LCDTGLGRLRVEKRTAGVMRNQDICRLDVRLELVTLCTA
jgi:hypothetical protein